MSKHHHCHLENVQKIHTSLLSIPVLTERMIVGRQSKGSIIRGFINPNPNHTITSINMEEPQPHNSQNRIIKRSDYRYITKRIQVMISIFAENRPAVHSIKTSANMQYVWPISVTTIANPA